MPGYLVQVGATVQCAHQGTAQPSSPVTRVLAGGQPVTSMSSAFTVAGCTFPSMSSGAPPCATANWTTVATRVFAQNQALILLDSVATCVPTGTPLTIVSTQTRVSGT